MATAAPRHGPWLYGAAPDLLFGCGGMYALLFCALVVAGPSLREGQPTLLFPLIAMLAGTPHYGATLLRVYEHRKDRRGYAIFSVWATLAVGASFVAGVWIAPIGTFLVTLYLTWSPWHYTGQNYGIAVMMLRRAGVDLDTGRAKRWLYASFVFSYALVFVMLQSAEDGGDAAAGYASAAIHFQPLGIPLPAVNVLAPLCIGAQILALLGAGFVLLRRHPARALVPAGLLALTQILWFTLPFALRFLEVPALRVEAVDFDLRAHYFLWIALGHFAQYLWVTSYYAKQGSGWPGGGWWYAKVLACGAAIWSLPALLLSPIGIGPLSLDLGLAILVASAVNIHHFILDGAIWKLRGRIADVLIRSRPDDSGGVAPESGWRGLRWAVWAACAGGLALYGYQVAEKEVISRALARGDAEAVSSAWDRLGGLGFDEASGRTALGFHLLRAKQPDAAREQFQRSLELGDLPRSFLGLARSYSIRGQWKAAAFVLDRALEDTPDHLTLLVRAAEAWRHAGEPERALRRIEHAAELAPDEAAVANELQRVRSLVGT